MDESLTFLIQHGYSLLFAAVLLDQLGLPMPAEPFLIAAGALARDGKLSAAAILAGSVAASTLGHVVWYEAGRRAGARILHFVCQISIEPDACVRRTENLFTGGGGKGLIVAHFVPGLDVIAQPLAAISGMTRPRFLAFTVLSASLWTGAFGGAGFLFGHQLEGVAEIALRLGFGLLGLVGGAFVVYLSWKIFQRQRLLHELRVARISAAELKQFLDRDDPIVIVDLRHPVEFEAEPFTIPGAIRMAAEELDERNGEIPRDREVVLYCS